MIRSVIVTKLDCKRRKSNAASSEPRHDSWNVRSGRIDGAPTNQNEDREGREQGQTNLRNVG